MSRGLVFMSLLAGLCLLVPPQCASADTSALAPRPYDAEYHARSHGMSATATRSLSLGDNSLYQLQQGLSVSVLGATLISIRETSQFHWQENQAIPSAYRYRQRGFGGRREHLDFDRDHNTMIHTRDGREQIVELTGIVLDPLGFSVQLSMDVKLAIQEGTGRQEFEYDIADGHRVVSHLYRITGEDTLDTEAGELATIVLERVRDPDSPRTTVIWLARDHDYILARLEQVSSSGARTELRLTDIHWHD